MTKDGKATRRWVVRLIVYIMLFASAGAAFLLNDWLWRTAREGRLPVWSPLVPVIMFTVFVVVYVIDRWLLITRRRYPQLRAFFQVGIAVAFLILLWQPQAEELRRGYEQPQTINIDTHELLLFANPEVRAAGCELAGYRGAHDLLVTMEALANDDASMQVRRVCRAAVEKLRSTRNQ
jgi:hypothetical protein